MTRTTPNSARTDGDAGDAPIRVYGLEDTHAVPASRADGPNGMTRAAAGRCMSVAWAANPARRG